MIKKLRWKFIGVSLLSLAIVLTLLIGVANRVNYLFIVLDADDILEILWENRSRIQDGSPIHKLDASLELQGDWEWINSFFALRYVEGEDLDQASLYRGRVVTLEEAESRALGLLARESGKNKGFLEGFRFLRVQQGQEEWIIFVDCRPSFVGLQLFMLAGTAIAFVVLWGVFGLLLFFSTKILSPICDSYEKQKRFITDAGHEIKTPLAIIEADAQVLEMEVGPSEWIEDIHKQIKRLSELTNDLVYLSKMEESGNLQKADVHLSALVQEMLESFSTLARSRGRLLYGDISPDIWMRGDAKALGQLISVLLENAIKYCRPEGKYIYCQLRKKGRMAQLEVWNEAQGVPEEKIKHMFDRFYRMNEAREGQTGGYGIGLSIAKAVTLAHKGKIEARLTEKDPAAFAVDCKEEGKLGGLSVMAALPVITVKS